MLEAQPPDPQESPEEVLAAIGRMYMPFGMFGPQHYPPKGVPICDLPIEYLAWWELRGYPKGRLGHLMRVVYEARAAGGDAIFSVIRHRNGGRYKLRKTHQKEYRFDADGE